MVSLVVVMILEDGNETHFESTGALLTSKSFCAKNVSNLDRIEKGSDSQQLFIAVIIHLISQMEIYSSSSEQQNSLTKS